jgi:hypothetical protein
MQYKQDVFLVESKKKKKKKPLELFLSKFIVH